MFFNELSIQLQVSSVISILFLMVAFAVALWRITKSDNNFDRVLALDLIGGTGLCLFVVLAIILDFGALLDTAFAIAVVSFLGTVAFAKYLAKGTGK